MTDPEARFEACETPRAPGMTCCLPAGHLATDTFHETEGGTQFTNSGKIGLGKIGSDFAPRLQDDEQERNPHGAEYAAWQRGRQYEWARIVGILRPLIQKHPWWHADEVSEMLDAITEGEQSASGHES